MSIVINDVAPRAHYIATSGQAVFDVPFEFLQNEHLVVYVNGILCTYDDPPDDAQKYKTTGEGLTGGGTIEFGPPYLSTGDEVIIYRDMPIERVTDLPTTGRFPVEMLNQFFDETTAMIQQTEVNVIKRSIRLRDDDFLETLNPLPDTAERINRVLGFDHDGQPVMMDAGGGGGGSGGGEVNWDNVTNKPDTFPPTLPIPQSGIVNLPTDLAAKAPLASPTFTGDPKAPTPATADNDTSIATTAFVKAVVATLPPPTSDWGSITGKPATFPPTLPIAQSGVTNLVTDLAAKAPLVSPAFTGNPVAPTPAPGDNDSSIATTAFVNAAIAADTTAWSEISGKPSTFPPTLPINESDVTGLVTDLAAKAPINSPVFTGNPTAPTPGTGDNDTSIATTAFVKAVIGLTPSVATVSDAAPPAPIPGQLWYESDTGNTYVWYNDGTSIQWVQVNTGGGAISNPATPPATPPMTIEEADTTTAAGAKTFDPATRAIQLMGRTAYGTGGFLAKEVAESGALLPGQFKTNANLRRWENAEAVITPSMFASIEEMFQFTRGKILIPAGTYVFNAPITTRNNCLIEAEMGAVLQPSFEPVGTARNTPLFTLGAYSKANCLRMALTGTIDTIKVGFKIQDYSQVGHIEVTCVGINENRLATSSPYDIDAGGVVITGSHITIDNIFVTRHTRPVAVLAAADVTIRHLRMLEHTAGLYVSGTRDLHVLSGYATGLANATANASQKPQGAMTPGMNAICLAGCSDSSFSNFFSSDALEHAYRVGAMEAGTSVPNWRLTFNSLRAERPYGCGFKMDDGDVHNIKHITINNLVTVDVGNDNWFGQPGYQNWSSDTDADGKYNNDPSEDIDGNKEGLAIRNSQHVQVNGFRNHALAYNLSGYIGLWLERSHFCNVSNVYTEKSKTDGVRVQAPSDDSMNPEAITLSDITTHWNGAAGLSYNCTSSNTVWRGIVTTGLDSQRNGTYGVVVTARGDGGSPYTTLRSRIEGFTAFNTSGSKSIASAVSSDADFIDDILAY